jgi:hypothetical protein
LAALKLTSFYAWLSQTNTIYLQYEQNQLLHQISRPLGRSPHGYRAGR